jgi:molybdate transport system regulatory protein
MSEVAGLVWMHKAECKFLGGYKITLLEKIDEYGSITKAAKAAAISYKTAWDTINLMNNLADKPLVERMAGGKGGGGTHLTAEGKKVLLEFKIIHEEHRNFLNNLSEKVGDADKLYNS